jgi:hypothetical protein
MRLQFQRWVTSEVVEQLHDGKDPEQVRPSCGAPRRPPSTAELEDLFLLAKQCPLQVVIDFKVDNVKPLLLDCFSNALRKADAQREKVIHYWSKAGLLEAWEEDKHLEEAIRCAPKLFPKLDVGKDKGVAGTRFRHVPGDGVPVNPEYNRVDMDDEEEEYREDAVRWDDVWHAPTDTLEDFNFDQQYEDMGREVNNSAASLMDAIQLCVNTVTGEVELVPGTIQTVKAAPGLTQWMEYAGDQACETEGLGACTMADAGKEAFEAMGLNSETYARDTDMASDHGDSEAEVTAEETSVPSAPVRMGPQQKAVLAAWRGSSGAPPQCPSCRRNVQQSPPQGSGPLLVPQCSGIDGADRPTCNDACARCELCWREGVCAPIPLRLHKIVAVLFARGPDSLARAGMRLG